MLPSSSPYYFGNGESIASMTIELALDSIELFVYVEGKENFSTPHRSFQAMYDYYTEMDEENLRKHYLSYKKRTARRYYWAHFRAVLPNFFNMLHVFLFRWNDEAAYFLLRAHSNKIDFQYWADMEGWTLPEAICLLLHENPDKGLSCKRQKVKHKLRTPLHNRMFELYLRQAERKFPQYKENRNHLFLPIDVLRWAQDCDIAVPRQLLSAVEGNKVVEDNRPSNYSGEPAALPIINTQNKETLLWVLGVCLHKHARSQYTGKNAGHSLARALIEYAKDNDLGTRTQNAVQPAIQTSREALENLIFEIIDESQAVLKLTKSEEKSQTNIK